MRPTMVHGSYAVASRPAVIQSGALSSRQIASSSSRVVPAAVPVGTSSSVSPSFGYPSNGRGRNAVTSAEHGSARPGATRTLLAGTTHRHTAVGPSAVPTSFGQPRRQSVASASVVLQASAAPPRVVALPRQTDAPRVSFESAVFTRAPRNSAGRVPQPSEAVHGPVPVAVGSPVHALYEGCWYSGVIQALPQDDPESLGRWAVQCDADEQGIWAYVQHIRPWSVRPGGAGGVSGASNEREHFPGVSSSADHFTGVDQGLAPVDASSVVVNRVTTCAGEEYTVVCDSEGNELGSFDRRHIAFELVADAESLRSWVGHLDSTLLVGLLSLLADEAAHRGARLHASVVQRNELRGPEDYLFFGLDENCSDQALERAYRRLSARLHPDKGGDERAFAEMKQKYDRLRQLRGQPTVTHRSTQGNGFIEWDPSDYDSMLRAHEDLHLQLVWIANAQEKVDAEIAQLCTRRDTVYSLGNGVASESEGRGMQSADFVDGVDDVQAQAPADPIPRTPGDNGGTHIEAGVSSCGQPPPLVGAAHTREGLGTCLLCLEPLTHDPSEVVNLCSKVPRCLCLLHRRCFLDPCSEMSDQLRRCMICKTPADPDLVRQAVRARAVPPSLT